MTTALRDDPSVVQRILDHIDRETTDLADDTWREPVANYRSRERLDAELAAFRRLPLPFCPSAALPENGSYLAGTAGGTAIVAVRGKDGVVRAFRNACRHRGTLLAEGAGCAKAFVCRYHGWTYALEGELRHVPHEYGFPGLDKTERGLVPLRALERGGVVFVSESAADGADAVDLPEVIPSSHVLVGTFERDVEVNWKILVEGFLEGYHIRTTHPQTFYPLQYDNLNVVETFGRNSRIAFPYRAIEKLRDVPPAARSVDGKLTYVHHLFPSSIVASFPAMRILVVLEPLALDRTRFTTYRLAEPRSETAARAFFERGSNLVDAGGAEDQAMAFAIQRGLASGANDFFEFGRCEGAITHFHRTLRGVLAGES